VKEEGQFKVGAGRHSESVFGKALKGQRCEGTAGVELIVPVSVSPAAAGLRFAEKREEWFRDVFQVVVRSKYWM